MKLTKTIFFVSAILLLFVFSANAQRHYKRLFPELHDEKYYETIIKLEQKQAYDSMISMADAVFNEYYDKKNPDRAVFLFFSCLHRPTGSKYNARVMPMLTEKLKKLRAETDTMNVHYANLLQLKGFGYKYQYEMEEAMRYYRRTEALFNRLEAPELLKMGLYQSMGSSLINLKRHYEAYSYLKQTLPAFKNENLLHDLAFSYLEIARAMTSNNQLILAYEFNKEAHDVVSENFPRSFNNVVIPNNLSDNCLRIDKLDEALYYSNFADSVIKANDYINDLYMVYFSILANRGIIHRKKGEYKKAGENFRELERQVIKYTGPESTILPNVYAEYISNFLKSNQTDSAMVYIEKQYELIPDDKTYYSNSAKAYIAEKDYKKAIQALRKERKAEDTDAYGFDNFSNRHLLADSYKKLYQQKPRQKYLDSILFFVASAERLISTHRDALLIGADDASLAKTYHELASTGLFAAYEIQKQNKNKHSEVLHLMSSATAFKLNSEAGSLRDFDLDVNRQLELMQKIRSIENQLLATEKTPANKEKRNAAQRELFETRVEAFELSYRLQARKKPSRTQNPAGDINFQDIQKKLRKDDALLVYFLQDENLYSLTVTKDNTSYHKHDTGKAFAALLNRFYRKIKTGAADFENVSAQLYNILIKPLEKELENKNKITFIPDGMLNRIPFDALAKNPKGKTIYLAETHAISYQYSVPLWLKSKQAKRKSLSFTGFAPVFLSDNKQAQETLLSLSPTMRDAYADMHAGNDLKPLPYSEKEVRAIHKLFVNNSLPSRVFLHEEATEEQLKTTSEKSSVIHIATHGISSYENPELSGLFFQSQENPQDITNDGFMFVGEIYMLNLDADLVVLSACKSGAGKINAGEGVMALPRPFIFIDVPNMAASLWKIHDEKTQMLMTDFYKAMIENGQDYAQALQSAKLKSIRRGELPKDWAALILIGR